MPTTDEQATDFFRRLMEHATLDSAARGEGQDWFRVVWTRLLVALGDEPIEYLDGELGGEWTAFTLDLVLYTPSRMVRATGSGPDNDPEVKVWTCPRRLLKHIEIDGGTPFTGSVGVPWPGRVFCTAVYPDETLRLPETRTDADQRSRFMAFLPSLLADLG